MFDTNPDNKKCIFAIFAWSIIICILVGALIVNWLIPLQSISSFSSKSRKIYFFWKLLLGCFLIKNHIYYNVDKPKPYIPNRSQLQKFISFTKFTDLLNQDFPYLKDFPFPQIQYRLKKNCFLNSQLGEIQIHVSSTILCWYKFSFLLVFLVKHFFSFSFWIFQR